ncbi:MAG: 2-oxoacid:acceptor oxidoreductase family protein [Clostridiales Family XIII bacterium]|jgi:pyruvate ferredoxin oxidoreductase gamma subunit|nr:2-oxoacid:acceptor oxidoreductase family protein [Clostridiales Family XIII bacterium]
MLELRWHGRGGQGAKTAALLLADAAFETGLYVQGFPEYGPERMGAPITAYNRLSQTPIRVHSNIYEPDIVIVVDETLLKTVDVTAGLKPNGKLLVNSGREPSEILAAFPDFGGAIYVINAADISIRTIGKNLPNTPLLSAVVKLTGVMEADTFFTNMEKAFTEKFSAKPEVIAGNLLAIREAWTSSIQINE